ncbi:MAG: hypothetical protein Q9187_002700 [Circinaria calcarea]
MARSRNLVLVLHILFLSLWTFHIAAYTKLAEDSLRALPGPGDDFNIKTGALLAPILRPRVSGSPGSIIVLNHLVDFFKNNLPDWNISFQNSTSKTPVTGDRDVPFVNMIATRDPPWTSPGKVSRLTLVAHYDSKITPDGFIGATDSAAPCAMLLQAARSVDKALTKKWAKLQTDEDFDNYSAEELRNGLQIIFLDGEEAFQSWTATDSIYGARSLAAEWENTFHPALSTYQTPLASISLFLLLDLLGAKNPKVPSYYKTTHWAYKNMADLENRLRALMLFESSPNHPSKRSKASKSSAFKESTGKPLGARRREPIFLPETNKRDKDMWLGGLIGDDHVPFMDRGVEVLHIIPSQFPPVWHELTDDGEHLDLPTVRDWSKLVTAFVGEWMDLEGFFERSGESRPGRGKRDPTGKTEL